MTLRFIDRITTLVKADAHGIIDSLEERTLLLKQYLREAELAFDQSRARLDTLREEAKRLDEDIHRQAAEVAALDDDVRLALDGGKEELARFAVRRLIPRRKDLEATRARLLERQEEARTLEERLGTQATQLERLRTRVRAELARAQSAPETPLFGDAPVADEEIELELMRRRAAAGREA